MADRSFANRVVLPVTDATYRNGEEKPAMRWSFEMGVGAKVTRCCLILFFRVREGFVIVDQCSQLNIARFRVTISVRDFQVTANCPKCRVFAIDSQQQWNAAIFKVITKEQELIDRFPRSGLSFLFMIIHYPCPNYCRAIPT